MHTKGHGVQCTTNRRPLRELDTPSARGSDSVMMRIAHQCTKPRKRRSLARLERALIPHMPSFGATAATLVYARIIAVVRGSHLGSADSRLPAQIGEHAYGASRVSNTLRPGSATDIARYATGGSSAAVRFSTWRGKANRVTCAKGNRGARGNARSLRVRLISRGCLTGLPVRRPSHALGRLHVT